MQSIIVFVTKHLNDYERDEWTLCSDKMWLQLFMLMHLYLNPPSPRVLTEWNFIKGLSSDSLLGDFE